MPRANGTPSETGLSKRVIDGLESGVERPPMAFCPGVLLSRGHLSCTAVARTSNARLKGLNMLPFAEPEMHLGPGTTDLTPAHGPANADRLAHDAFGTRQVLCLRLQPLDGADIDVTTLRR